MRAYLSILMILSLAISLRGQEDTTTNVNDYFDLSLEELLSVKIYSATKFEESLKKIPHSVYILNRADI